MIDGLMDINLTWHEQLLEVMKVIYRFYRNYVLIYRGVIWWMGVITGYGRGYVRIMWGGYDEVS
jgi:hypothetical protein